MWNRNRLLSLLLLLVGLLTTATAASSVRYLEITREAANIRTAPSANSGLVATARRGDLFLIEGEEGNWYQIHMFSGESRFIYKPLGQVVYSVPEMPADEKRMEVFRAWFEADRRAEEEAAKRYDPERRSEQFFDRSHLLNDRYKLKAMHELDVNPVLHRPILIEGFQQQW